MVSAVQRENLSGVEQPRRIEYGPHAHLLLKVLRRELDRHQVALLDADPVLACETAADLDTELQNVLARCFGLLQLARLIDVEHDIRVQVPVASMEDSGHLESIALADLVDAAENVGKLAGWDGTVHDHVIGDAAHGTSKGLASFPDRGGLGLRLRDLQALGVERFRDRDDAVEHVFDLSVRALDLDDQYGLDVE